MSTVAYRDGVIASETMAVCSDEQYGNVEKVGRTQNYLFGFAGRLSFIRPTYQWIKGLDDKGIHPQDFYKHQESLPTEDNGSALIIGRDGQIWTIELDGFVSPVNRSFEGIGSGARYALGAMMHGASAVEGVEAASMLDVNSGERIIAWSFDDPVHCPNEKSA